MNIPYLPPNDYRFPEPDYALAECDGLVGASSDLDTARLLSAYRAGIFPWLGRQGFFYWFAVSPRAVILPEKLHVSRSLAKHLRNTPYLVTANRCFAEVVARCAAVPRPNQDGTWIAPEFQTAYQKLHDIGHAHSFECFCPDADGTWRLAGGFYGVQIGRVFYGESMFSLKPNASKTAFAHAVPFLQKRGIALIDCQQDTPHMRRFGSQLMDFSDFQTALEKLNAQELHHPIEAEEICGNAV